MEWVEGKMLSESKCSDELIAMAAKIQGNLHKTLVPEEFLTTGVESTDFWQDRLKKNINFLKEGKYLTVKDAEKLIKLSDFKRLVEFDCGLTHGDFCPDNLLIRENGDLNVIDFELLAIRPLAFDLAKTTFLWPMNQKQRKIYIQNYKSFHSTENFFKNFSFWMIFVLASSAAFHIKAEITEAKKSIKKLRKTAKYKEQEEFLKEYRYNIKHL